MDLPKWRGLFDWSMRYQDGTRPSDFDPREYTPEKRKWLEEALKHYMQDFCERMKEIKDVLDKGEESEEGLEEKENMLEELMDIVSSIDYARDLHKLGGLQTLLQLLGSQHAGLRWRAAEVVATCVQNNLPVQQWFLEGGAMPPLVAAMSDADPVVRAKALLALSSITRHFPPALELFRLDAGLPRLVKAVGDTDARVQRKAAGLLTYLCEQHAADAPAALDQGLGTPLMAMLASDQFELRESALGLALELGHYEPGWRRLAKVPELMTRLQELQRSHEALSVDGRDTAQEEVALTQRLLALLAGPPPSAPPPPPPQPQPEAPPALPLALGPPPAR